MKQVNFSMRNKQGGFSILGVILVVVAIVGALGIWAMSGQTNTSNAASSASSVTASGIVNDSSAIKTGFDTLLVNGAASTSITFVPNDSASPATNILDTAAGIQLPVPSTGAVGAATYPKGQWTYQTGIKVMNVGVSANADIAMVLPDVKDGVCQSINLSQHGAATIPASGIAESAFTTGGAAATPSSSNAVDMSATAAIAGWTSGCVGVTGGTSGASNVYFRVLKAN